MEHAGALPGGNTKPPARGEMSKYWCFTFNNYTEETEKKLMEQMEHKNISYIYGKEIGENGTHHLQGYIESPIRIRPIEALKTTSVHWERRRGTREEAILYCVKDGIINGKGIGYKKPLRLITELRPWQDKAEDLLLLPYDDRRIWWIYDPIGGSGKGKFLKWYKHFYNVSCCLLAACDSIKDIACNIKGHLDNHGCYPEQVIINVPKMGVVNYELLEMIKDGFINCPKYESCTLVFNEPNIIVMANHEPKCDLNRRIEIKRINREFDFI